MNNRKWLKRKYPKSFNIINEMLNDEQLQKFRAGKYKAGIFTECIAKGDLYTEGKLCMFKRANPIDFDIYPLITVTVKCCTENFTPSGYHTFYVTPYKVEELLS